MAWIELGRLGAPYGTKGWLHVESYTDPPDGLLRYREWALKLANGERVTRRVASGRGHGRGLVAQLEGVASREGAARLTGAIVCSVRPWVAPTNSPATISTAINATLTAVTPVCTPPPSLTPK